MPTAMQDGNKNEDLRMNPRKHAIRKYWDWRSVSYPWDQDKSRSVSETWESLLADLVAGPAGRRAIDMGTGTGQFAVYLGRLGFRVIGIDISERMVRKARENARSCGLRIDFQTRDAENLLFRDDTFDVIVSRNLLWTLPHPEKALKEWRRVLKPTGTLIVSDGMWRNPTWARAHDVALRTLRGIFRNGSMVSLRFFCAYAGLQKALPLYEGVCSADAETIFRKAGFRNIRFHDISRFDTHPYESKNHDEGKAPPFFVVQAAKC